MAGAGSMSFSFSKLNTVEWIVQEPTVVTIKMSTLEGDENLAQLEFFDGDNANIGRGKYILRHGTIDGPVAPYVGERYVVDYRNHYTMVGPDGNSVFYLNHQKQQSFECYGVKYIVRDASGAIKQPHV
jgi:hypothetical protein